MEVIRDDLCFILDLEGFFINKTFHVRELGYYTWNEEHGRHAFRIPVPRQDLAQKDKQTVNFVIRKIHGLSYQPSQAEHPQHPRVVLRMVQDLYGDYSTPDRTVVGYKGGHVEKDLLNKLNIPSLNLETLGCPKYDVLRNDDLKFVKLLPAVFTKMTRDIIVQSPNVTPFTFGTSQKSLSTIICQAFNSVLIIDFREMCWGSTH